MLPVKVEVPRPETVRRLATSKDVDEAMGRTDFPVTVRMPEVTAKPLVVVMPVAETPPANVEVPVPDTVNRSATSNEVDDAMGMSDLPVTEKLPEVTAKPFVVVMPVAEIPPENVDEPAPVEMILPPVSNKSPAVDSMPDVERSPAAERPPVKEDVAEPETVRRFAMAALPSCAWPVTSRPPAKVEVPRPEMFTRLAILNEVEEATGKMEASAVEVALKTRAWTELVNTPSPVTANCPFL